MKDRGLTKPTFTTPDILGLASVKRPTLDQWIYRGQLALVPMADDGRWRWSAIDVLGLALQADLSRLGIAPSDYMQDLGDVILRATVAYLDKKPERWLVIHRQHRPVTVRLCKSLAEAERDAAVLIVVDLHVLAARVLPELSRLASARTRPAGRNRSTRSVAMTPHPIEGFSNEAPRYYRAARGRRSRAAQAV